MARKSTTEKETILENAQSEQQSFTLDMEEITSAQKQEVKAPVESAPLVRAKVLYGKTEKKEDAPLINCLSNRTITVHHIPQPGTINNPKHVLFGGMAETSTITFTVPRLRSGLFVDVLKKDEKNYLEYIMGLQDGALNVYNRENNFWDNQTEGGISKVRLGKQDTILHLNDPVEYIQYKILLANKELIAPNLYALQENPKATYQFVLISNDEVSATARTKMSIKKQCYMEYGKIEENKDVLQAIVEIITSKTLAPNTPIEYLQTKAGELIEKDAKLFLSVIKDELLSTRILIKKCVEQGFISRKGDFYYLRSDNSPLCEGGQDPTLTMAAKYLSNPKRQEMKFSLEAKLK